MPPAKAPILPQPHLTVLFERARPVMATPMYMTYGITRQVDLPADILSRSVNEQQQAIREVIVQRAEQDAHSTPFGKIVGYRFTALTFTMTFNTAGELIEEVERR